MTTHHVVPWIAPWLMAVLLLGTLRRPQPSVTTSTRLHAAVGLPRHREPSARDLAANGWGLLTARVGRGLRRLARRSVDDRLDRRLGSATVAAIATLPVDIRLAMIVGLVSWMRPVRAERRVVQQRHAAVLQELPEVVDLLSVAVRGGLTIPLAVAAVGERLDGEVADALHRCVAEASLGQRLSDRLEQVPAQLGDATRPLVRALVAADRYGVPIGDPLERVAADVRTARRRSAEVAARRVPIKLLFPLVFCVLPSFALLTVAPVLASSLESLRL